MANNDTEQDRAAGAEKRAERQAALAAGRPTWLPDIGEYRTPSEDWKRFTSVQQPFWSTRAPMEDVGVNLLARYQLGAPYMGEAGVTPSFGQFIEDWPVRQAAGAPAYPEGYRQAAGLTQLREMAGEAARAARTAPGTYLGGAGAPTPGSADWNRRAWLTSQFGYEAEGQETNLRRVANLIALQRGGDGGTYRGAMANAIRDAMGHLYQQRLNIGKPKETFLDWYLGQSGSPRPPTGRDRADILRGFDEFAGRDYPGDVGRTATTPPLSSSRRDRADILRGFDEFAGRDHPGDMGRTTSNVPPIVPPSISDLMPQNRADILRDFDLQAPRMRSQEDIELQTREREIAELLRQQEEARLREQGRMDTLRGFDEWGGRDFSGQESLEDIRLRMREQEMARLREQNRMDILRGFDEWA